MKILALDTAASACSAALWRDGKIAARQFEPMARGQAEMLMGMISGVLAQSGCGLSSLDLLAVTIGPGAFTGLRIGLSAAKGFSLALSLPCLGVTTLEAVASQVSEGERAAKNLLVVLDSKRADVYAQAFDASLLPLGPPCSVLPCGLASLLPPGPPALVAGDAASMAAAELKKAGIEATLSSACGAPDAAAAAKIAALRFRPGDALVPPSPLYLRPADAIVPKDGGRLRP